MNYYNTIHTADLEQYIVKPGDSLYMIAKRYGVTVEELKNMNHLVSNLIYPNQILFIPKRKDCVNHITKPNNDCVNSLINKYSNTLNEISNPNRDVKYYMISENDDLDLILMKFNLTHKDLLVLNQHKLIIPGEKIIIEK